MHVNGLDGIAPSYATIHVLSESFAAPVFAASFEANRFLIFRSTAPSGCSTQAPPRASTPR